VAGFYSAVDISQTLRGGDTDAEARSALLERIQAMAHAQSLLTRAGATEASVVDVVLQATAAFTTSDERFRIGGPPVMLSSKQALSLSLALHELATNAVKYGALSNEDGRVHVTWTLGPGPGPRQLRIVWREIGGPPVSKPQRRGFGSRVIVGGLAHQLDGMVDLDFAPAGVICTIVFQLPPAGTEEEMMDLGSAA